MDSGTPRRFFLIGQAEFPARPLEPALYLVATPIGNLGDITIRALETLAAADVLACEDTRVSRVLLERYGIRRRTTAYHEHNAAEAGPRLIAALEEGRSIALISDAGTPLVSDPGYRLVGEALERGLRVVPIPGPSAALAALTVSGLPSDAFLFAGFLPVKAGQKRARLEQWQAVPATLIFFESPRRVAETLDAMARKPATAACRNWRRITLLPTPRRARSSSASARQRMRMRRLPMWTRFSPVLRRKCRPRRLRPRRRA
jgi:16S rRNA (cytidine1402-2'-O)-methyltransferase